MIMLKILVGPNGCGKTEYLNRLAGYNTHINTTSGLEKLREIEIILDYDGKHVYIDNVDAFIDNEKMEKLVALLTKAAEDRDVFVATHNPMFLNYLEDDQAIESVFLVKNGNLYPYFIEETLDSLHCMGPGEIFVDTDLSKWWRSI